MLGIDERTIKVLWTIFLAALLIAIAYAIRATLLVFALAIFFAYVLSPIVGFIERFIPKRRNLALAAVYCLFVGLLVLAGLEIVPAIADQLTSVTKSISHGGKLTLAIPLPEFLRPFEAQVNRLLSGQMGTLQSHLLSYAQEVGKRVLTGLGAILPVILVPILAFFFLKDGEALRVNLIGAVERGHDQSLMERILDDIHVVLKSYIRALVILAVIAFGAWAIFLKILGYPYDLLLAGVAGFGEFIPVVGPLSALVAMIGVCLISGTGKFLALIIFWGVYRMFADYVLNPYLMSAGIELHPLLVLFGVLGGEQIAGIPGMFFSIPIIAILRVVFVDLRTAFIQRQLTAGVVVKAPAAPVPQEVTASSIILPD